MHWINDKPNAFVSQFLLIMGILLLPKSKTDVLWKLSNLSKSCENYWGNTQDRAGVNSSQIYVSNSLIALCISADSLKPHTAGPAGALDLYQDEVARLSSNSHKRKEWNGPDGSTEALGMYTSPRRQQTDWQVWPFIVTWLWKGEMSLPESLPHLSHRS